MNKCQSILVVVAVGLLAQGCALGRLTSYGMTFNKGVVALGDARFVVAIHPKEDVLLVQRLFEQAMGSSDPKSVIAGAVEKFLVPTGCTAGDLREIANITWEAPYSCPPGVDLRALVKDQRESVIEGKPLRLAG